MDKSAHKQCITYNILVHIGKWFLAVKYPKPFTPCLKICCFSFYLLMLKGSTIFFPNGPFLCLLRVSGWDASPARGVRRLTRKLGQARPRGEPAGPAGGAPAGVRLGSSAHPTQYGGRGGAEGRPHSVLGSVGASVLWRREEQRKILKKKVLVFFKVGVNFDETFGDRLTI